jgi:tRNA-dihydrouridine synthase A
VRDFVGTVADAGCSTFIVHARNAWLQGISPKENRDLPPLKPDWVVRLKQDFPALAFVINGGITSREQIQTHLQQLDGVMIGREAYHNPWSLSDWDALMGCEQMSLSRDDVEAQMVVYMQLQAEKGIPWFAVSRHMLGLRHAQAGARRWRQIWSDHKLKHLPVAEVAKLAMDSLKIASHSSPGFEEKVA